MMSVKGWRRGLSVIFTVLLLGAQAGCDSSVEPGDHAAGVVFIRGDGSEAARYVYPGPSGTGTLAVTAGETATYRVRVLTESGEIVDLDSGDYSIDNVTITIGLRASAALQGDDQIVITGLTGGDTNLFLDLKHGGHAEWGVKNVKVSVLNPT